MPGMRRASDNNKAEGLRTAGLRPAWRPYMKILKDTINEIFRQGDGEAPIEACGYLLGYGGMCIRLCQ